MKDIKVMLSPIYHRGSDCIAIRGHFDSSLESVVRNSPGRRFSKTHGCWYVGYMTSKTKRWIKILTSVGLSVGFLLLVFGKPSAFHLIPYQIHLSLVGSETIDESTFIDTFDIAFAFFLGWLTYKTLGLIGPD